MFTIVLVEPKIPPNTGTIARLCAATNIKLDLVGDLGFSLDDKSLKRAGLDYWHLMDIEHHPSKNDYIKQLNPEQFILLTTKSDKPYYEYKFKKNDYLIFGSETLGLDEDLLNLYSKRCYTIPMKNKNKGLRSLNLAVSTGIVLYEGLRQISFKNKKTDIIQV